MILMTEKRDETKLDKLNISNACKDTKKQLLEKVTLLTDQNECLLDRVDRLEGIRGALEEKVSAYRHYLKEVTKQLDEARLSSWDDKVVYHNKDNLERRRFSLNKSQSVYKHPLSCDEVEEVVEWKEKYDCLLEQYMYEQGKNEQLFNFLLQTKKYKGIAELELLVHADAAATLLEATKLSRQLIQQAQDKAQNIQADSNVHSYRNENEIE